MVRNAAESLKPGGFFIGTTPDADTILDRLNKAMAADKDGQVEAKFGNSVYRYTILIQLKILRGSSNEKDPESRTLGGFFRIRK